MAAESGPAMVTSSLVKLAVSIGSENVTGSESSGAETSFPAPPVAKIA